MLSLEQLQQDIQLLPEEAQTLLADLVEVLKKRYVKSLPESSSLEVSPYQKFKDSGFIGCVSIEEDLSTTYKQMLIPRKRRQVGSAAGQIWMAPDFDEPLKDFDQIYE